MLTTRLITPLSLNTCPTPLSSLLSPSPLLCLSFLSPTLPPVSPLPLCHSLSSLYPLPSFVSVILFTNTSTCISPSSVPLLVFSLTPPLFCVSYSFHQHSNLYLPSLCATPCVLSNPSHPLCLSFSSSTLPPVSPLPLCNSLSSL